MDPSSYSPRRLHENAFSGRGVQVEQINPPVLFASAPLQPDWLHRRFRLLPGEKGGSFHALTSNDDSSFAATIQTEQIDVLVDL